ncbi:MAG: hypothetical protein Ctma_0599 [Catillopecten margaritatus gill symbiont]|uniref:SHSP domain-containing protein n=1 Tax=Catillopecten margaritatus gill symbiont TaxID=3083288 RepID=A0AAU6PFV6_9GAMM
MKKTPAIAALLISTVLNAHYNHSGFFNDNFWNDFEHQFQQFDRQITKLQHTQSRQYFDKNSNAYILELKTQGVNKRDLSIKAENNRLTIKGQHKQTNDNAQSSNTFLFTTSLPANGDITNITTDFKNGILKVSIPKHKRQKSQSQKTAIQ